MSKMTKPAGQLVRTLFAAVICCALTLSLQAVNPAQLNAQGKNSSLFLCYVKDKATNKPIVVEYKILDSEGNSVVKGRTTPKEGLIKQVMDQGKTYTIKFSGLDILSSEDTVHIQDNGEYYIAERERTVRVIKAGNVLMEAQLFSGASLSAEGKRNLDKVAKMLMSNRQVNVQLSVGKGGAHVKAVSEYMKSKGRIVNRRLKVVAAAAGQKDDLVVKATKVSDPFN